MPGARGRGLHSMIRKRVCSCGTVYKTETNEVKCPSCKKFNDYRVAHPQQEKKNQPDEIHFAFYPSYTNKILEDNCKNNVLGVCERDKKDDTHYSVTIN